MGQLIRKPIVFALLFALQPIVIEASQRECGPVFGDNPQSTAPTNDGQVQSVYTLSFDKGTPLTLSQTLAKLTSLQQQSNKLNWEDNVKYQRLAGQYLRALVDARQIELFKSYLKSGLPVWFASDLLDDGDGGGYTAGEYAFETAVQQGLVDFVEAAVSYLKEKNLLVDAGLSRVTPLTAQALSQNSNMRELLKSYGFNYDSNILEQYRFTPNLIQKLKGLSVSKSMAELEALLKVLFPSSEFIDVRINRYPSKPNESGDSFYNAKFRFGSSGSPLKPNMTVVAYTKPVSFLQSLAGMNDRTLVAVLDDSQQSIVSVNYDIENKQFSVLLRTNPDGSVLKREETEITVNFGADELVSMVTLASRSGLGLHSSIETLRFKDLWSTSMDFDAFNELNAAKFNYKLYPSRNGVVVPTSK